MFILLTALSLGLLAALLVLLVIWVKRFLRLFSPRRAAPPVQDLPRAVVVLSVRGADPSLVRCLEGLLQQDYPDYDVRIIIDSRQDAGWRMVHRVLGAPLPPNVRVDILQAPQKTCSLKLSALVQALRDLDESFGVVALIDADVVPHRSWLRDLTAPLADPTVGAATGIRWYVPEQDNWGSLVRHLWNVVATVIMHAFDIPWGGSLAFRADVVRRSDVLERWSHSLFEDTGFQRVIADLGLRLRFVPAATMMNRESTDLGSCFRFIRRQLLNARLYHGSWSIILPHGILFTLAPALVIGMVLVTLVLGEWTAAACLAAGLVVYALALGMVLRAVERCVHAAGDTCPALSAKALLAIPLTQAVYLACLLSAAQLRKVDWRGITYEFHGPWNVRMMEYQPYRSATGPADRTASLV